MSIISARAAVAAVFLASGVAACGDDGTEPSGATAEVRLFNGASSAPAIDLLVNGVTRAVSVPYGGATNPIQVGAGTQEFEIRDAMSGASLGTLNTILDEGAAYALTAGTSALNIVAPAAVDTGAADPDRANLRIMVVAPEFTDSASAPPPTPLDVHIAPPGTVLEGRTPELSLDARFPSYSTLLHFDPGTVVVTFVIPSSGAVAVATDAFGVGPGEVRAVMVEQVAAGVWSATVVEE